MNRTIRSKAATVVLAAAATAGILAGVGVAAASAASAASAGPASYSTEAFRETIKPWDSISIPALSCPTGYFQDVDLSPGRIVPKGVEVLEPNAIGVTISEVKSALGLGLVERPAPPSHGYRPGQGLLDGDQLGPDHQQGADHPAALHHGPDGGVHGPVAVPLIVRSQ